MASTIFLKFTKLQHGKTEGSTGQQQPQAGHEQQRHHQRRGKETQPHDMQPDSWAALHSPQRATTVHPTQVHHQAPGARTPTGRCAPSRAWQAAARSRRWAQTCGKHEMVGKPAHPLLCTRCSARYASLCPLLKQISGASTPSVHRPTPPGPHPTAKAAQAQARSSPSTKQCKSGQARAAGAPAKYGANGLSRGGAVDAAHPQLSGGLSAGAILPARPRHLLIAAAAAAGRGGRGQRR